MTSASSPSSPSPRHRSRRRVAAWALPPVLAASLAACTSDDEPDTDDFEETLSSLGGQTVDDTTIVHTPGSATVSIGGLEVELPRADQLADMGSSILIPPDWPTLEQIEIRHPEAAEGFPRYGLVTFAQTDLVTDDDTRQRLLDQAFVLEIERGVPVVHTSTVDDPDTGIVCHTTVRSGPRDIDPDGPVLASSVVLIEGPGIASSGIIAVRSGEGEAVPELAGDIAEAACGQRPEGL